MNSLRFTLLVSAAAVLPSLALNASGAAAPVSSSTTSQEARLIVRFKQDAASLRAKALSAHASSSDAAGITQSRAQSLGQRLGLGLMAGRALDERTQVVRASESDAKALMQKLRQDAEVEWVAVDQRRKHYAVPNDPRFLTWPDAGLSGGPANGQWYLKAPDPENFLPERVGGNIVSSVNAVGAWDRNTGSANVVVAVIDTGVRYDHPDLAGKLLPGYDMISEAVIGNDGDARDDNAEDPGDWITEAEANQTGGTFYGCTTYDHTTSKYLAEDSSWHGTQVAGLVGAASNNLIGMAGVSWGAKILPVRVLGKCGGYDSDIVASMRWAAGLTVPGVPTNPNPARVLNLSLGGSGSCDPAVNSIATLYREAIGAVTARGAVVVVAAGNTTGRAVNLPASCPGVVSVVALRHIGTKVGFSDLGPEIAIAAPGGNCVDVAAGDACLYPMLSTVNAGLKGPTLNTYTDAYNAAVGTSFSAPLVAGTVALMLSEQPGLNPSEVISLLKGTARAFPSSGAAPNPDGSAIEACHAPDATDQLQCYCTTSTCGAGMLDAAGALTAAGGVLPRISVTPAKPQVGQSVQLSSADSLLGAGRSIKSYGWILVDGGGIVSAFSSATNASTATLPAATTAGSFTVRLAVTDDLGMARSTDLAVTVVPVPAPAPAPTPSGGGGGAASWAWLLGLALAALGLSLDRQRGRPGRP